MNILDDLKYRGLIYQTTDEEKLKKRLAEKPITLYCGFDPSADSLHVGNLLLILLLKRFQLAGNKIIAVAGGGTGLIGDPSGKSEERKLNSKKVVKGNLKKIARQLKNILGKVKLVNNYDWLGQMPVIDYLRDIGKNFPVNYMLDKETVRARLAEGISFTEFNYMILQSIDFLELYKKYGCELQIGGSDQWGNITAGIDLIRKIMGQEAFCLTAPLITKEDGSKFGKTESGTIWLDAPKTSPYEFYQFWINTPDSEAIKFLKYFTFLSKEEIGELEKGVKNKPEARMAQRRLAFEVTKLVHGEKIAKIEKVNSEAWFSKEIEDFTEEELEIAFKKVPSYEIKGREMNLIDLLVEADIVSSKRQAREDVQNNAVSVNGKQCVDLEKVVTKNDFLYKKYLVIRKGKKNYYLIKW